MRGGSLTQRRYDATRRQGENFYMDGQDLQDGDGGRVNYELRVKYVMRLFHVEQLCGDKCQSVQGGTGGEKLRIFWGGCGAAGAAFFAWK